ncbi:hypothetical protein [Microlunatus sp. GCM10028923]|uniref:Archaellin n=2 Tax=Microlunatus parietis TaxID=682979 RepID=A0A7Y9L6S5_9ACTN|nr:archaellin [Microlunatus parietis]
MIKRVFWFLVGAGVAAFVAIKIRDYLQQATPEAIGNRVADSAAGITERAQDFADRVRAAMVEREAEINDALGRNPE